MSVLTPNMNLIESTVGSDTGLSWEQNLNASLDIIDGHNHSVGSGVQINPDGININTDLSFNINDATEMRSIRFSPQTIPIPGTSPDIGALYEAGVDLYFNDGNGNQIRLTQSGSIAGATGSIAGLVAPASASYVALSKTFIFQSDVNTPANIDVGSVIIRDVLVNSFGITLSPPAALAADYAITFPAGAPQKRSVMNVSSGGSSVWQSSFDAIVGSGAQVTAGVATHSSLTSAIAAVSTNQSILVLVGAYTENVTLSKSIKIVGEGRGSAFTGTLSLTAVSYAVIQGVYFTGNLTIDSSSAGNQITGCFIGASATVTDSGAGDYLELIQG